MTNDQLPGTFPHRSGLHCKMGKINHAVQRSEQVSTNQKRRTSLSNAHPRHPVFHLPLPFTREREQYKRLGSFGRGKLMLNSRWSTRGSPDLQCVSLGYPLAGLNISESTPNYPSNGSTRALVWSCMSCGRSCAMRLIDILITNRCSFGDIRNGYVIRVTAI